MKLELSVTLSWQGEERHRKKASNFSDVQKSFIIVQVEEGTLAAEFRRKAGIDHPNLQR